MCVIANKGNTMTNDYMSGVSAHLMTNIKACYDKVLAQSTSITKLFDAGPVGCLEALFNISKSSARLDYIKGCSKHNQFHQSHWQYDYMLSGHWE